MNILLSSVGRRGYLVDYFKESLQGTGQVVATNTMSDTTGMIAADISEVIPPANNAKFIAELLDICRQNQVRLLCSLHDWESRYIAEHKDKFIAEGIIPVIPATNIVEICLDKFKTFQFAKKIGIPTPNSFVEIEKTFEAIKKGEINYPLILKPRWGQGSIFMHVVHSNDELESTYKLINSKISENGMTYLSGEEIDKQIIIQQFISGKEYGVDIINDLNGNFVTCFIKQKLAMRSGETDIAETVCIPEIENFTRKISVATNHLGILDADFFMSDNGEIVMLELNPRFGGGYPFSHIAGANIPAALIAWAEGNQPNSDWLKVKIGIRSYKDIRLVKA